MPDSIPSKLFLLAGRLLSITLRNPRGLRPVFGHALAEAENHLVPALDTARLPAVLLSELVEDKLEPLEVTTSLFPQVTHSISFLEAFSLGVLLRKAKSRRVFEFGTNRGISTTQLALNVGPEGKVFTLDLPRQNRQTRFDIKLVGDLEVAHQAEKADLIPARCLPRVVLLEHDSATFDETPYLKSMDAVFVDGAHIYDYVRNDSEKGWRMLRPGGILIWHDFRPQTPDVMRYLLETDFKPKHIVGTTLAFAEKPVK
jgi:predicted O-methyltransferase YrrM